MARIAMNIEDGIEVAIVRLKVECAQIYPCVKGNHLIHVDENRHENRKVLAA